jgi:sialic acid synthase SpsE
MHHELIAHCKSREIGFLSTGFDIQSVDLLASLGQDIFKIPSGEITNLPYLRHIGSLGKSVIVSTGMATMDEIQAAIDVLNKAGTPRTSITVLHCTTEYPAPIGEVNLRAMHSIQTACDVAVGYSDHTQGIEVAIAAVAMGATVIEKHFTLDRNGGGPDDSFSLEPADLKQLCESAHTAWQCLGDVDYGRQSSEKANVQFRRSLYFVKDLKAGDVITEVTVRSVRPGYGLAPKYMDQIKGRKVIQSVKANSPVQWDRIESA